MWTNFILKVSSLTHRKKEQMVEANVIKTFYLASLIILLELLLFLISLPIYIFVSPQKFSANKNEIEHYKLKRKVSLLGFLGFFLAIGIYTFLISGLIFSLQRTETTATSESWNFDSALEYIYDSSTVQIVDGNAVFTPSEEICTTSIQPIQSISIENIAEWSSFVEIANKNGGEIYYQISNDEGLRWQYWDNGWRIIRNNRVTNNQNHNTATEINENISSLPTESNKILFKAILESDCVNTIQLLSISISSTQQVLEITQVEEDPDQFVFTNEATERNNFSASTTSSGNVRNLAESQNLNTTWTVNQGGDDVDVWIMYDMGEEKSVRAYEITPVSGDSSRTPKDFTFQGSKSSNSDFEVLDSRTNILNWISHEAQIFILPTNVSYRYYKIQITASGHPSRTEIARIRIFSTGTQERDEEEDFTTVFCGGTGAETDPYLICTPEDLNYVRNNLTAYYKLENDLDMNTTPYNTDTGWEPIGTELDKFTGSLDGAGSKVQNLYINRPGLQHNGLFGYLGEGSNIKDLGILNPNITGGGFTGGLAGQSLGQWNNYMVVHNIYVKGGSITGEGSTAGIIGYTGYNSVLENVYSETNITGAWGTGGISGSHWGGAQIINSLSLSTINPGGGKGGVIGQGNSPVLNTYWNTEIFPTSPRGTGKTTSQLKDVTTFSEWDINITDNDYNNGYPFHSFEIETQESIWSIYEEEVVQAEPILEILSPNGSEVMIVGDQFQIEWVSENISENVRIEYSDNNFETTPVLISNSSPNTGSFEWTVSEEETNTGKIRIIDVADTTISAVSNGDFTITRPASMLITYPSTDTLLVANAYSTIKWDSVNLTGNVSIEYSTDNFMTEIYTITEVTSNNGTYLWHIPYEISETISIKITSIDNPRISVISDSTFQIVEPISLPTNYWPLDENQDCIAKNLYGSSNGLLMPTCDETSPSWTDGKVNSALSFNGTTDYIEIENERSLNPENTFSLSAWVKWDIDPESGDNWASIINKDADTQYRLQHNYRNTAFEFAIRTSRGNRWIASTTVPEQGEWYFLVGTYNGQKMKLYINGLLESTTEWTESINISDSPLFIGQRSVGDRNFSGTIDEIGIWNRALTDGEIIHTYLNNSNSKPEITINEVQQNNLNGYVYIDYDIADNESHYANLNRYQYSLTGEFAGEQEYMTEALISDHSGIFTLNTTPEGKNHTFVWNVKTDLPNTYSESVYIRMKAEDGISESDFVINGPFTVDSNPPVVENVVVKQILGTTEVMIQFDVTDENNLGISVELMISDNGGENWVVPVNSLTGDIEDIESGSEKIVRWDAGTDYFGKDQSNMILSVNAYDTFLNKSIDNFSNSFDVDTKAPLGLDNFTSAGSNLDRIIYSWTPAFIENNFSHYEIWYGENLDSVEDRSDLASKWSFKQDENLGKKGTASTTIGGLEEGTTYYAKIWAVDIYGNETDTSFDQTITKITPFSPILDQPESPTTSNIVEITGLVPIGSFIELYLNDELTENITPDEFGRFNIEIAIEEGNNEIFAIAVDELENRSYPSETVTVEYIIEVETGEEEITDEETVVTIEITTEPQLIEEEAPEIFITAAQDIIEAISTSRESPIIQKPEILGASTTGLDNTILFSGTGIPNSEIVIFVHSDQAIVYRTEVDNEGKWEFRHSQNEIQLETGIHEIYAVTLDSESQIKSASSEVLEFNVETNTVAIILSYFDLTTTVLTIVITSLAIAVFVLSKKSNKELIEQNNGER